MKKYITNIIAILILGLILVVLSTYGPVPPSVCG